MEKKTNRLEKHIFICTNQRHDGRECCAEKGSEDLQKKLKEWVKADPELKKRVKVSKSGCLSHCEKGMVAVIYPESTWLSEIKTSDLEDLKKLLLS